MRLTFVLVSAFFLFVVYAARALSVSSAVSRSHVEHNRMQSEKEHGIELPYCGT